MLKRPPYSLCIALLAMTVLFIANAWITEDAYISFRVLEQAIAGNGLRWNPHERVQAYTHPLWLLVLLVVRLLSSDVFINAIAVSYLCITAVVILLWKHRRSELQFAASMMLLMASKAFIDYSSSGLENPLSYLLVGLFVGQFFRFFRGAANGKQTGLVIMLIASLAMMNRHDHAVLLGPACAYTLWELRRLYGTGQTIKIAFLGALPFGMWTLFSIFYYGVPFPNTAYAKLGSGADSIELAKKGLGYLQGSFLWDPITLSGIALCITCWLLKRKKDFIFLSLGILLQLIYVVKIGGDFMSGRFLSVAFTLSVFTLGYAAESLDPRVFKVTAAAALLSFFLMPLSPLHAERLRNTHCYTLFDASDERACWYEEASLMAWFKKDPTKPFPNWWLSQTGLDFARTSKKVTAFDHIGYFGYYARLDQIIVDPLGLSDPLLARMPATPGGRVGHFYRAVPKGYKRSLASGRNMIESERERQLYDLLTMVTQKPLLTRGRFAAIVKLNLTSRASDSPHSLSTEDIQEQ